ncbi:hypothetical protein CC86DRAFT_399595 [Ophiobolus disseminans]|uniref:CCHC-type domain-containing protein n=1 Tax=Ophiobolus disseminans TaxID=1469910 RepID=A0A6A7AJT6_9PLEO|nr:hypothetical protein CC86DRAFT_399595 [Ophiobolus disseminans]
MSQPSSQANDTDTRKRKSNTTTTTGGSAPKRVSVDKADGGEIVEQIIPRDMIRGRRHTAGRRVSGRGREIFGSGGERMSLDEGSAHIGDERNAVGEGIGMVHPFPELEGATFEDPIDVNAGTTFDDPIHLELGAASRMGMGFADPFPERASATYDNAIDVEDGEASRGDTTRLEQWLSSVDGVSETETQEANAWDDVLSTRPKVAAPHPHFSNDEGQLPLADYSPTTSDNDISHLFNPDVSHLPGIIMPPQIRVASRQHALAVCLQSDAAYQPSNTHVDSRVIDGLRDIRLRDFGSELLGTLHLAFYTEEQVNLLRPLLSEANWNRFCNFDFEVELGIPEAGSNMSSAYDEDDEVVFPLLECDLQKELLEDIYDPQHQELVNIHDPLQQAQDVRSLRLLHEANHRRRSQGHCHVCGEGGHFGSECLTCEKCHAKDHNMRDCTVGRPTFHKFMALPVELRKRIYEDALYTGDVIIPHLCNAKDNIAIKFHDDNHHHRTLEGHCSTSRLLGITHVSKQLRDESLPCFYSANTFSINHDTATYFSRLQALGRFHMVRHVRFGINMRKEHCAAQTLQHMHKHIQDMEDYEREVVDPAKRTAQFAIQEFGMKIEYQTYQMLRKHPMYTAGGLQYLAEFTCLRMLTSHFTGVGDFASKLVVPVPGAHIFSLYSSLKWFPDVCHGLGMHLHLLEGHELSFSVQGCIGVTWHQQFQKKDFGQEGGSVDVKKRVMGMGLHLQEEFEKREIEGGSVLYYRSACDGQSVEWYKVLH